MDMLTELGCRLIDVSDNNVRLSLSSFSSGKSGHRKHLPLIQASQDRMQLMTATKMPSDKTADPKVLKGKLYSLFKVLAQICTRAPHMINIKLTMPKQHKGRLRPDMKLRFEAQYSRMPGFKEISTPSMSLAARFILGGIFLLGGFAMSAHKFEW